MWTSSLFWKLFLLYCGLTVALSVGFFLAVGSWQRAEVRLQIDHRLHDTAAVLRSQIRPFLEEIVALPADQRMQSDSQQHLQATVSMIAEETGSRLTIIGAAGEVWADSERTPETMQNHADRPELQKALEQELGTATRSSPTLGLDMQYLALAVNGLLANGDSDRTLQAGEPIAYIRVATELTTVQQRVSAVRRYMGLFALIVAVLAAALTYWVVGRIVKPVTNLTQAAQLIASGKEGSPVAVTSRDEIGTLAESFNAMHNELHRRVQQLQENHDRLSTVLSSMDEGVIAVDANENILFANEASRVLLEIGIRREIGRPLQEACRNDQLLATYQQCLRTGTRQEVELQLGRQRRRVLAIRASRLPGTPPPGVVIVLHDVSELRRLENLRREFVTNVSHELKTPLAAIMAYAETLRRGAINDVEHNLEFVKRIEEQAARLHQLILDILQLARIEAKEEAFESIRLSLAAIVGSCVEQHESAAESKGIELCRVVSASEAFVLADEDGMRTILDNLIGNAIKYTPAGGRVTVSLSVAEQTAVVDVEDTGIGIAEDDQRRVFERFFRADKARSRAVVSTGLGLAIVKHLVQAFGGGVSVHSELGVGSRFRVQLPLAPVQTGESCGENLGSVRKPPAERR